MYTCCPICKTNFNVTEAQLQVAQGKVRCGSCKNVFNARQHINYRSPVVSQKYPQKSPTQNTESKSRLDSKSNQGSATNSRDTSKTSTAYKPNPETRSESATPTSPDKQIPISATQEINTAAQNSAEDINAIFNALDTQLTQGTYIDIGKLDEVDIREAAFDDIFEADDNLLVNQKDTLLSNSEIDLDEYQKNNQDEISDYIIKPLDHIHAQHHTKEIPSTEIPLPEKTQLDDSEDDIQQHTFDFISPTDESDLSPEVKEQPAYVKKPLKTTSNEQSAQQADRAALHQAIDNIIKVDNNIPTPFDQNDAHHFVINVEAEPDVELVDENDIDKLFASTDSLRISDLKFDKYKTAKEKEEHVLTAIKNKMKTAVESTPEVDLKLESEESEITSFNNQAEGNVNPDNFTSDSLTTDDFNLKDLDPDQISIEDEIDFEDDIDPTRFEEEIVLSSPELDAPIPHRLRDAVASLEQPPVSISKRLLYFLAVIILITLIGVQLVLFKSTAIANMFPTLQPFLVSMCESLPCRYTGNHNNKQIEILNRDVRLHPQVKGALLISATIINQASYTQPYPTILLKFTDLTGATVAQRFFQPKEYLGLLNKPFALMPSKKPVQLNIEVLDPGSEAINFQFSFL